MSEDRLGRPDRIWIREDRFGIDLDGVFGVKPIDIDSVEYIRKDLANPPPSHPSPRCAKCDAAAWSWRDGIRYCHYCQTPFPASSPSQDSQEVGDALIDAYMLALANYHQCRIVADEIPLARKVDEARAKLRAALLSQSPKGAAGAGARQEAYAEIVRIADWLENDMKFPDTAEIVRRRASELAAAPSPTTAGAAGPDRALAMETLLVLACKELIRRTGNIESQGCRAWWQGKEEGLEGGGDGEPSAPKTGLRGAGAPGDGDKVRERWAYGIVDKDGNAHMSEVSVCKDADPLWDEVQDAEGSEPDKAPYAVVPLYAGKPLPRPWADDDDEEPAPGDVGEAGGADHG